ncbi:hypothetical protein ACP4OV_002193 [Aristida adscensionis]
MDVAATNARTNAGVVLFLSLSPSSKAIAKQQHGGGRRRLLLHGARRPADDGGGAFQCRTCGRRFATFQALGGHRTSHKRPRVRAAGLDLLLGARPGKGAAAATAHRCHACGEVFPTGQALGGHMRRHRAEAAGVAVPEMTPEDLDDGGHLLPGITLFQFI